MRAFMVLGALLMAGLAGQVTSSGPAPTVLPEGLQDGDRGAYTMRLEGDWVYEGRSEGEALPGLRFEVLPADTVRSDDGRLIEAQPIRVGYPATDWFARDIWQEHTETVWSSDGRFAVAAHGATQRLDYTEVRDCILDGPARWDGLLAHACQVPGLRATIPAGTPVRSEPARLDGLDVLHITAEGTMEWWYAGDLPVPLRLRFTDTGPLGMPRTATLDLAGFRPGDGDLPTASSFAAPPLETAPLEVWGLDDEGIDHPFRLSTAFDAALRSASFAELREWLRYHPDGYVFEAAYREAETITWDLHLSDGDEGFSVRVTREDGLLGSTVRATRIESSSLAASAPPMHEVPPLPTIASVWDRWAGHAEATERNAGPNAWSFRILATPEGEPVVRIAGGIAQELRWGVDALARLGLGGTDPYRAVITLDHEGRTVSFQRSAPSPADPPTAVAGYAVQAAPPPHTVPMGAWAALAAAAWLAWPWAKAAVGLFSRLRPDELLEHPARARIMDALRSEPGQHFHGLSQRLGEKPGRVRHHLHKLVQGGLVCVRRTPGYTCYVPADAGRALADAAPLLRAAGPRRLMEALHRSPGSAAKAVAEAACLSPATASYHLKRLRAAGLVDAQREGRALRLHLSSTGQEALHALT